MTAKIQVLMLRKNRSAERFFIGPDDATFDKRGRLYMVPKEAINSITYNDKPNNPHAELIYVEENPVPFSLHTQDKSAQFLDDMVIENFLESTAEPKGFFLEVLKDYLKSPGKIMLIAFAIIIVVAALKGIL